MNRSPQFFNHTHGKQHIGAGDNLGSHSGLKHAAHDTAIDQGIAAGRTVEFS